MNIRPIDHADVRRVVDIHLQAFEFFFLTSLGPRFLATLYTSILEDPTGISLLAFDDQNAQGFVVGTTEPAGFYRRLIVQKLWKFCVASFPSVIKNPRILPRLFRALSMPRQAALPNNCGLLMSIGVSNDVQNKGLGRLLVGAFLEEAARRGLKKVYLTTDKNNNNKVNAFYESIGFRCDKSFVTPEGRWMNEYVFNLPMAEVISNMAQTDS